jgi:hypothetical protein
VGCSRRLVRRGFLGKTGRSLYRLAKDIDFMMLSVPGGGKDSLCSVRDRVF